VLRSPGVHASADRSARVDGSKLVVLIPAHGVSPATSVSVTVIDMIPSTSIRPTAGPVMSTRELGPPVVHAHRSRPKRVAPFVGEACRKQAVPDLDSEALDFRAASESFAPIRRFRRTDLQTVRLVTTPQGWRVR
jgi:hypothetical protein